MMLANPRRSRVILINPGRAELGSVPDPVARRWRESLGLVPAIGEIFGVEIHAVGDPHSRWLTDRIADAMSFLAVDPIALWRQDWWAAEAEAAAIELVFLGGAWLDEDVLTAALTAAGQGYDVRLMADLAVARNEEDRQLVITRLALHGIETTTLRQTMLEWASNLDGPAMIQRVQELLS
ncbi:hypothetical protein CWS35_28815 [Bradyrhizobium sp. SK17]|uniref:isochorismatase family protein n=1 Tax=Bradyrhizobium sp. SK17 TaxID=2057741 RepID=UPI000C317AAD|nr:isochorismatase family protein [Bradyrhizobium sp. SK17]AUC97800.1 hypothetical protein CWS35_28815 [Bradyrhizobium sp. SK17]